MEAKENYSEKNQFRHHRWRIIRIIMLLSAFTVILLLFFIHCQISKSEESGAKNENIVEVNAFLMTEFEETLEPDTEKILDSKINTNCQTKFDSTNVASVQEKNVEDFIEIDDIFESLKRERIRLYLIRECEISSFHIKSVVAITVLVLGLFFLTRKKKIWGAFYNTTKSNNTDVTDKSTNRFFELNDDNSTYSENGMETETTSGVMNTDGDQNHQNLGNDAKETGGDIQNSSDSYDGKRNENETTESKKTEEDSSNANDTGRDKYEENLGCDAMETGGDLKKSSDSNDGKGNENETMESEGVAKDSLNAKDGDGDKYDQIFGDVAKENVRHMQNSSDSNDESENQKGNENVIKEDKLINKFTPKIFRNTSLFFLILVMCLSFFFPFYFLVNYKILNFEGFFEMHRIIQQNVSKDQLFRNVTEVLNLPEASKPHFSVKEVCKDENEQNKEQVFGFKINTKSQSKSNLAYAISVQERTVEDFIKIDEIFESSKQERTQLDLMRESEISLFQIISIVALIVLMLSLYFSIRMKKIWRSPYDETVINNTKVTDKSTKMFSELNDNSKTSENGKEIKRSEGISDTDGNKNGQSFGNDSREADRGMHNSYGYKTADKVNENFINDTEEIGRGIQNSSDCNDRKDNIKEKTDSVGTANGSYNDEDTNDVENNENFGNDGEEIGRPMQNLSESTDGKKKDIDIMEPGDPADDSSKGEDIDGDKRNLNFGNDAKETGKDQQNSSYTNNGIEDENETTEFEGAAKGSSNGKDEDGLENNQYFGNEGEETGGPMQNSSESNHGKEHEIVTTKSEEPADDSSNGEDIDGDKKDLKFGNDAKESNEDQQNSSDTNERLKGENETTELESAAKESSSGKDEDGLESNEYFGNGEETGGPMQNTSESNHGKEYEIVTAKSEEPPADDSSNGEDIDGDKKDLKFGNDAKETGKDQQNSSYSNDGQEHETETKKSKSAAKDSPNGKDADGLENNENFLNDAEESGRELENSSESNDGKDDIKENGNVLKESMRAPNDSSNAKDSSDGDECNENLGNDPKETGRGMQISSYSNENENIKETTESVGAVEDSSIVKDTDESEKVQNFGNDAKETVGNLQNSSDSQDGKENEEFYENLTTEHKFNDKFSLKSFRNPLLFFLIFAIFLSFFFPFYYFEYYNILNFKGYYEMHRIFQQIVSKDQLFRNQTEVLNLHETSKSHFSTEEVCKDEDYFWHHDDSRENLISLSFLYSSFYNIDGGILVSIVFTIYFGLKLWYKKRNSDSKSVKTFEIEEHSTKNGEINTMPDSEKPPISISRDLICTKVSNQLLNSCLGESNSFIKQEISKEESGETSSCDKIEIVDDEENINEVLPDGSDHENSSFSTSHMKLDNERKPIIHLTESSSERTNRVKNNEETVSQGDNDSYQTKKSKSIQAPMSADVKKNDYKAQEGISTSVEDCRKLSDSMPSDVLKEKATSQLTDTNQLRSVEYTNEDVVTKGWGGAQFPEKIIVKNKESITEVSPDHRNGNVQENSSFPTADKRTGKENAEKHSKPISHLTDGSSTFESSGFVKNTAELQTKRSDTLQVSGKYSEREKNSRVSMKNLETQQSRLKNSKKSRTSPSFNEVKNMSSCSKDSDSRNLKDRVHNPLTSKRKNPKNDSEEAKNCESKTVSLITRTSENAKENLSLQCGSLSFQIDIKKDCDVAVKFERSTSKDYKLDLLYKKR